MSLQIAAQHLAAQGRGPDTTLVHMTPGEVKGLQAIAMAHGGSLTINPQTGLPEAGFLSSILPMVAGIALGPAGLGLSARQAGLAAGALGTLATGSLKKGLMAGLGAYGGAGLMGSVTGAGEAALQAANTAPATGVTGPAMSPISITPPSPVAVSPVNMANVITPGDANLLNSSFGVDPSSLNVAPVASSPVYPNTSGALGSGTSNIGAVDLQTPGFRTIPKDMAYVMGAPTPGPTMMTQPGLPEVVNRGSYGFMDKFSKGVEEIGKDPSKFFNKENMKYGAAALGSMMFQDPKAVNAPRDSEQYRYAYDPGRQMPPTREGDVGEYTYYQPSYTRLAADGGIMSAMPVQSMSDRNDAQMMMANGPQMYAGGGLSHLGDYSDGGRLLRGPGDGVSDDIPATIANKRPARLADGEFVVPARIVSELGNGSTDAGARKLYAMMDRVQKNRGKTVGKNKVAVNSRSEKLLPA